MWHGGKGTGEQWEVFLVLCFWPVAQMLSCEPARMPPVMFPDILKSWVAHGVLLTHLFSQACWYSVSPEIERSYFWENDHIIMYWGFARSGHGTKVLCPCTIFWVHQYDLDFTDEKAGSLREKVATKWENHFWLLNPSSMKFVGILAKSNIFSNK